MRCELCRSNPETIVLLPIRQPDGKLVTFACLDCSKESGHYCLEHDRPHLGLEDNTSACIICIEEAVQQEGEKIAGAFATGATASDNQAEIREIVEEYLEGVEFGIANTSLADLPLASRVVQTNTAQKIARPIVCFALRHKIDLGHAVQKAIANPGKVFLGIPE